MYYRVISGSVWGMQPYLLSVEADVSTGMPYFNMVGMLASEVKEARERVRAALKNCGFVLQAQRITVNLSPADRKKSGVAFDLPIAIAILRASKLIPQARVDNTLIIGELGLDGRVHGVKGVLPIIIEAKKNGIGSCIIPRANLSEISDIDGINIIAVNHIKEVVQYIIEGIAPECGSNDEKVAKIKEKEILEYDFSDVYGHSFVKRAAEIAVAGRHNLMMIGPPGAGKSMIAKRIPGIMPQLDYNDMLEVAKIYSICGLMRERKLVRPFRSPHHTITVQGMTGGGKYPHPGEITLSHRGVMFLDELPEFNPAVIETLREPMENRAITVTRTTGNYVFEADTMIVAAMNPCKCGYYPDRTRCHCTDEEVARYVKRISGAIIDRMDICVEVPRIDYNDLKNRNSGETSSQIRERIVKAITVQKERYKDKKYKYNSTMTVEEMKKYCQLDEDSSQILEQAYAKFSFSTRSYYKVIKIARTIADLDESINIEIKHLTEAIGYATADKKYWG